MDINWQDSIDLWNNSFITESKYSWAIIQTYSFYFKVAKSIPKANPSIKTSYKAW